MERSRTNRLSFERMTPTQQYEYIRRKQMTSCLLCIEGKKIRDQLADHFILNHADIKDDKYSQYCNCPNAVMLQMRLIDHLLKHVMNKRKLRCKPPRIVAPKLVIPEVISIDDEAEVESKIDEPMNVDGSGDDGNASDDYFTPFSKEESNQESLSNPVQKMSFAYKCKLCPKSFKFRDHLHIHTRGHFAKPGENKEREPRESKVNDANRRIMCEKCSTMVVARKMGEHMKLRHFSDDPYAKPLKCDFPECTAAFRSDQALKYHRTVSHVCEKPFMCEFCSETFTNKIHLQKHRIRHTDPEKWRCEECQKTYTCRTSLRKHNMRKHQKGQVNAAPRPFSCDQCERSYCRERDLYDHNQRVHIEGKGLEKPVCTICSKEFSKKCHLSRHMKNIHHVIKGEQIKVDPKVEQESFEPE